MILRTVPFVQNSQQTRILLFVFVLFTLLSLLVLFLVLVLSSLLFLLFYFALVCSCCCCCSCFLFGSYIAHKTTPNKFFLTFIYFLAIVETTRVNTIGLDCLCFFFSRFTCKNLSNSWSPFSMNQFNTGKKSKHSTLGKTDKVNVDKKIDNGCQAVSIFFFSLLLSLSLSIRSN